MWCDRVDGEEATLSLRDLIHILLMYQSRRVTDTLKSDTASLSCLSGQLTVTVSSDSRQ